MGHSSVLRWRRIAKQDRVYRNEENGFCDHRVSAPFVVWRGAFSCDLGNSSTGK